MSGYNIFIVMFLMLFVFTSCSNNKIKPIEGVKEIQFIISENGIVVNSGDLKEEDEIRKIVDLHNTATFIDEVEENILVRTVPLVEEFSNSSIGFYVNPEKIIHIIYDSNSIFKVIHKDEMMAYYIKSPELLEFIKENKGEK
ncbi:MULTISPECIES: hypothetical protein [Bacillus]|uniref:hypothetical protein n=1 Tax=Bacillus TaxID=1386 RepID=UPI000BB7942F|nr:MULTISPECIES: hypothetical protein [Bacillus]